MMGFGTVCTSVFGKGVREFMWHEEGQMNNEAMEGLDWNKKYAVPFSEKVDNWKLGNVYVLKIEIEWWDVWYLRKWGISELGENFDVAFI